MKYLLSLLFLLNLLSCSNGQTKEASICSCIATNFNQAKLNLHEELQFFDKEMIQKGSWTAEISSKLKFMDSLANDHKINFFRDHHKQIIVDLGYETIRYCILKEQYIGNSHNYWAYDLIRNLDYFKIKTYTDFDLANYQKERVKIFMEHFPATKDEPKLKKMILLLELYNLIPDYEFYQLDKGMLELPGLK